MGTTKQPLWCVWQYLVAYISPVRGINRIGARWIGTLSLLTFSFILITKDPYFTGYGGGFSIHRGIWAFVLGFVIAAALNWELLLFGAPRGPRLLLHIIFFFPVIFIVIRLTGGSGTMESDPGTLVGIFGDVLGKVVEWSGLKALVPHWFWELFSNCWITLLFVLIMGALSFKLLGVKIAVLIFFVIIGVAQVFISSNSGAGWLVASLACLGFAMWLMYDPYLDRVYIENVLARLTQSPGMDPLECRTILRLMQKAHQENSVASPALYTIVASEYGKYAEDHHLDAEQLKSIAGIIARKMVVEYSLTEFGSNSNGLILVPRPDLNYSNSTLKWLSIVPREIAIGLLAFLWLISPIDLIPDAVPFLGVLDDAAIGTISIFAIMRNHKGFRMPSQIGIQDSASRG